MNKPISIRELEASGKTFGDLCRFRNQLEPEGITVAYNVRQRVWILGQVPKFGPTFISVKLGTGALIDYMDNSAKAVSDFNRIARAAADEHERTQQ